jgi:signal transduction histidine kinase
MSLRLRLTLTLSFLVALAFLCFGIVLYLMMLRNVESEMDRRLRIRSQQVTATIWPQLHSLTASEITGSRLDLSPLADLAARTLYVQVLDRNGRVLATSDTLKGTTLPVSPAELAHATLEGQTISDLNLGSEGNVRMLSSPIRAEDGQVVGVLQVGQSRSDIDHTMAALRMRLLALGVCGMLVAGLSGWIISHRTLRVLSVMSEKAKGFADHQNFGGRLNIQQRDEVGRLALTIDQLLETVEATLSSHRQFLGDTSHELRNPLLALRTNLELLNRLPASESQECLLEAQEQVERMSRLVADLLLLARAEAAQIIERRPVQLGSLLERVVTEGQKRSNGQVLELSVRNDCLVLGDDGRLRQIFDNLLENALRHTPPSGSIKLSLDRHDGWARVDVQDTGAGISSQDLPRIFERFYRADRRIEGSGLGLAIVKHLSEAHGGLVSVESTYGHGSRFTVRLPVAAS